MIRARGETALAEIFGGGVHRGLAAGAAGGDVVERSGEAGMLRYWRFRHSAGRIVARGQARPRQAILKTGSFLLLHVDEGAVDVELYNGVSSLAAGDSLLATAIEPIGCRFDNLLRATWIELPIWWIVDRFGGGLMGARRRLDGGTSANTLLGRTIDLICEPRQEERIDDLVDLFGDILRRCLIIAERNKTRAPGLIDRITLFVAQHSGVEGLSPGDAAHALGCSVSSIHKSCSAAGTTFGKMVTTMRLSRAAYRLARDPHRISKIAFECGFASISHFCHAFKAAYGVTPKTMRQRHIG